MVWLEGAQTKRKNIVPYNRKSVQYRGQGTALETLSLPWDQVALFLKKYITYEPRYRVIYSYDFVFLSHLCHGALINIPYYLL